MLGWFVTVIIAVLIYVHFSGTNQDPPPVANTAIEIQDFTPKTLVKFNGHDDPHVLMAIKGKVYDVTPGKAYYGPGGPYENFAGRDASRGLAKHSFDPEMLTPLDSPIDKLEDLSSEEIEALDKWAEFFAEKYLFCGKLVEQN